MPLWGKSDAASNTCLVWLSQVGATQNSANRTAVFGNTTVSGVVSGVTVGIFGADTTEAGVSSGAVIEIAITSPGSGYFGNAAVTFFGGGGASATANAEANSTGKISLINITAAGSSYETSPVVSVADPDAQSFNAASAVNANGFVAIASNKFVVNDYLTYSVTAGNTAIVELAPTGSKFYVQAANSTGVYLSIARGGDAITLTDGPSETGHRLRGETATIAATVSGGRNKGVTPGWNLRSVGTGGRAGRVQNECLVAMRNIAIDAEDVVLPDA